MPSSHSVVVLGGTPAGICAGVRAAREGHDTAIVTFNDHLGGMVAGGLCHTDTLTFKNRSPLLEEFFRSVRTHYRNEFGPESEEYRRCINGYRFEPHVAEDVFERMVDEESDLSVFRGYYPTSVARNGDELLHVGLEPFEGENPIRLAADAFVDATYEGDLAATAGVPYRIGRESRSEYDEQLAGKLYVRLDYGTHWHPQAAHPTTELERYDTDPFLIRGGIEYEVDVDHPTEGDIDLIPHLQGMGGIYPRSTGAGDDKVQSYNYRLCLSNEPENRRRPAKPDGYEIYREDYRDMVSSASFNEVYSEREMELDKWFLWWTGMRLLPNGKADLNAFDLVENHDYPEADWERRREIARYYRNYELGWLYFLQNDDEVPPNLREHAREWGLATDEFEDNGNVPFQLYVREARRIEGEYTFTEHDARHAEGIDRTPINEHSIAIADYPLDAHAVGEDRQGESSREGTFYASEFTRPSQIPYGTLLPNRVENLLVPVAVSASHVGFNQIRFEPTWMHLGEVAGFATSRSLDEGRPPGSLDRESFQRQLVERGVMVSFFNEFDMGTDEAWVPAVQYLGTKGFFAGYDARPGAELTRAVADVWARQFGALLDGDVDPMAAAERVHEQASGEPVAADVFADLLERELRYRNVSADAAGIVETSASTTEGITRGAACRAIYRLLGTVGAVD